MTRPPSPGNLSDRYGWRTTAGVRNFHHGLDIGWAAGTTLVAPEDGVLTAYGIQAGWAALGRVAIIQGVSGAEHWLCHTESSLHALGPVSEGTPVAVMGQTGSAIGVHVHWETRRNGSRLDPESWLATTTTLTTTPATEEEETDMAEFPTIITVSHPDKSGNQVYWDVDLRGRTRSLIQNGDELKFRRAIGIPEYVDQAEVILKRYQRV